MLLEPAPHQLPAGQEIGSTVASVGQYFPGGQVLHESEPAVSWYIPGEQEVALMEFVGQKVPALHKTGSTVPPIALQ
jgi:hypothetical protein